MRKKRKTSFNTNHQNHQQSTLAASYANHPNSPSSHHHTLQVDDADVSDSNMPNALAQVSSSADLEEGIVTDDHELLKASMENVVEKLSACQDAMDIIYTVDEGLVRCNCHKGVAELEKHLLNMASQKQYVDGLLYCTVFENDGHTLIRYFESGVRYTGFIEKQARKLLSDIISTENIHFYSVHTEDDVRSYVAHNKKCSDNRSTGQKKHHDLNAEPKPSSARLSQPWNRLRGKLNKAVATVSDAIIAKCHAKACIVITSRVNAERGNDDHCLNNASGFTYNGAVLHSWIKAIDEHSQAGCTPQRLSFTTFETLPMPACIADQFYLLSCIDNYFWGVRPRDCGRGFTSAKSRIPSNSHFSFVLPYEEVKDRIKPPSVHLPNSSRNLIIHYSCSDKADHDRVASNVLHLIKKHQGICAYTPSLPNTPKRKRKATQGPEQEDNIGTLHLDCNMPNVVDYSCYPSFQRHMFSSQPTFVWRFSSDHEDIFLMNDMDALTGDVSPSSFVHATRRQYASSIEYTCTCVLFNTINSSKRAACGGNPLQDTDEVISFPATCAHCRFMRETLEEALSLFKLPNRPQTKTMDLLETAAVGKNLPAVKIAEDKVTIKFSVLAKEDNIEAQFVNLSQDGYLNCQSRGCSILSSVKGVYSVKELLEKDSLCPHLKAIRCSRLVQTLLAEREHDIDGNTEDVNLMEELAGDRQKLFNVEKGLWEIPAYSTHIPLMEYDTTLTKKLQSRSRVCVNNRVKDGYIPGPELFPDGESQCNCEAGYETNVKPTSRYLEVAFETIVYTRLAPMKCKVMKLWCKRRNCCIMYDGRKDGVFFLSTATCVGDEIGWDFVQRVTTSRVSFTAFVKQMTYQYKTFHKGLSNFMSRSTFVKYYFAWIAAFKIDFKKDVDVWCGERKVLAGDGTHLGISFSRLDVTPIEKPKKDAPKVTAGHKRLDRIFLYTPATAKGDERKIYCSARAALRKACKAVSSKRREDISDGDIDLILERCPQDEACRDILEQFLLGTLSHSEEKYLAEMLVLLAGDEAVSAFVPVRFHPDVMFLVNQTGEAGFREGVQKVRKFCPEAALAVSKAESAELRNTILNFLRYLVGFVKNLHNNDPPVKEAIVQPNTYDPESGIAYYMTEHGCKVRDIPNYELDAKRHKEDLFDDSPEHNLCDKKKVCTGGFNYSFFWFCPIHGHCLGYHIMPGSEGRKDPFSSLFSYLPDPPEEIYYDFACSFMEYSLNREPQYFCCSRFWHDLFHGFAHKCGPLLNSARISELKGINTSICEQFNSFLLNIRYTGSHMTQSHFCLFLQFMLHIWNLRKNDRCLNLYGTVKEVNLLPDD